MTLGKPWLFTFIVQVSWEMASSQYDSWSGKIVLKRLFIGDTQEALALQIHCLGLWETRLQAFSREIKLWINAIVWVARWFWNRACISDSGEDSALYIHCSGLQETELLVFLPGDSSSSHSPGGQGFKSSMIVLVARRFWKGCSSVILGEDSACSLRSSRRLELIKPLW